jgi:polysaccharide export outer membrane protein
MCGGPEVRASSLEQSFAGTTASKGDAVIVHERSNQVRESARVPRTFGVVTLFALFFAVGCSTVPAPNPIAADWKEYQVGAPDMLEVLILPDPVIELSLVVRPDGMISINLIGDVRAAGRTTSAISREIESKIAKFKLDANVTVRVANSASDTITVLGEVGRPSTFPLTRETRVIEAIGLVGGPTQFVSKANVRVLRVEGATTSIHFVNLRDIEGGDLTTNIVLEAGDIVYAPPNWLARIGYALQTLLFPFQPVMGAAASYGAASAF